MENSLLASKPNADCLFDLEYKGPSFNGVMEISALKNQIAGLEEAIKITAQVLSKHKKIDFTVKDIEIFVQAFEKGSFRSKVKVTLKSLKSLNNYQGAIALGALIVAILVLIQQKKAVELKDISPQLMSEIGDQVKVELLKDPSFLKSVSNVVNPLHQSGDKLVCAVPNDSQATIKYEDKTEFTQLSNGEDENQQDGNQFETLKGRINKVDLDAKVRHIGFKVNGEGSSIQSTLSEQIRGKVDMKTLLGQWVEIQGNTNFQSGIRIHIDISSIKIIQQQQLNFIGSAGATVEK